MEGTEFTLDTGTWLGILALVAAIVAWEWRKEMNLKKQVDNLEAKMEQLHLDHQTLLNSQADEHIEVLRGVTTAMKDLHSGIGELTHYIRWLGKQQTGKEPPPPLHGG